MAPKRKAGDGNGNGAASTKGAGKAAKKGKGKGNSSNSEIDDRPKDGIERSPTNGVGKKPNNFIIKRLIRYTDKAGALVADADCPIDMDAEYFKAKYGDFVLERGETREVREVRVKNYQSQERFVPRRMLQDIYLPWGMGTTVELADDGVGLPLAEILDDVEGARDGDIEFLEDEVVMDLDSAETDPTTVIDFERNMGQIPWRPVVAGGEATTLNGICEFPYDIRVPQTWLDEYAARTITKYGKGKDKGRGKKGGGKKNPEPESSEDSDDSGGQGPSAGAGKKRKTKAPGGKATKAPAKEAAKDPYNGWNPINKRTRSATKNATKNAKKSSAKQVNAEGNVYVRGKKYVCGLPTKKGPPCTNTYIHTSDPIGCWLHNGK